MASVVTIHSGSVCWLVQVDSSQRVCLRWLGKSASPPWRPRSYRYARAISAEQIAGMTHVRHSARPSASASELGATAWPALKSVMRDDVHP